MCSNHFLCTILFIFEKNLIFDQLKNQVDFYFTNQASVTKSDHRECSMNKVDDVLEIKKRFCFVPFVKIMFRFSWKFFRSEICILKIVQNKRLILVANSSNNNGCEKDCE